MTQSISLSQALEENGHRVSSVYVGISPGRKPPEFFIEYFSNKLRYFRSPNFILSADKKGIHILYSFAYNLLRAPVYIFEIFRLLVIIRKTKADRIINFFDMIGGLAYLFSLSGKPFYVISHHFFLNHPDFHYPLRYPVQRMLLKTYAFICALGADKKIALSFTDNPDMPERKLFVTPPMLRKEITGMEPVTGSYILVYILNSGFLAEIREYCMKNPGREVVVFTDGVTDTATPLDNLRIEPLSGDKFLAALKSCNMIICSAGFETITEAAYLGKKVWVIPTRNHYEQECNAADAERAGVAKKINTFDAFSETEYPVNDHNTSTITFWFDQNPQKILRLIT